MTDTLREVDEALESAEELVRILRERRETILHGDYGTMQQIAMVLHEAECRTNHTDGCGWGYEIDWDHRKDATNGMRTWTGWAHVRWLKEAGERVAKSGATAEEYLAALRVTHPGVTGEKW